METEFSLLFQKFNHLSWCSLY